MSTFRLATINVHSFNKPSSSTNNISELISILEPLKLDLIAVQEVKHNHKWKEFYQRLSLPFSIQEPRNRVFGNGIASRYSFYSISIQQTSSPCHGGMRSLLQCRLNGIDNLTFGVTHLDHINEDDRLEQIKEFNPFKQNIDILMGDMNALTREDYSDDYYSDMVVGTREKTYWEEPRFDLTQLITHEWNYQDAFKQINPTLKDQQVTTCRFGTRIDYIYVHPRVNEHWILTECSIIDIKGATDHNAVFAEFKQISK